MFWAGREEREKKRQERGENEKTKKEKRTLEKRKKGKTTENDGSFERGRI